MPQSRLRTGAGLAALARLYVDIALWRRGPQDVPAVGILLPLSILAYVLVSAATGALLPKLQPDWMLQVGADAIFVGLWYLALLSLTGRRERYVQTATAIFGLQTVLAAPSLLAVWLVQRFGKDPHLELPVEILALTLELWMLVATAYILRAALDRKLGFCFILALSQMLTEELVLIGIFQPVR